MLSLFKKKVPIRDLLSGSIDIHNHILPGIDDGAANVEDSVALIKKYRELGITHFIATPHVMNDYYPNTRKNIKSAFDALQKKLSAEGLNETMLRYAAEYMMDQPFLDNLKKEKLLPLFKNYVLVEMSYFQPPINLNEILFELQTKNYKPVLAHPERYGFYHSRNLKKYEDLKTRGCHFQLNILSLIGHYGKGIQEIAFRLLDKDMIDFVGTDTHQMRHLEKLSEAKIPKSRMEQLKPIFKKTNETFRLYSS
ncbi:MAG TPA: CpsB/CapC family capsule biosynthesis tyrosine phosphatase [Salinimicrobium sp.]|nr:CpsB/CapC family capsule biosynthesis tyrosine phosphatase [Salinimicrobium sp.]